VARQREFLEHARRAFTQGARRDLAAGRERLESTARTLAPTARRSLQHELERTDARARRLQLVDPRHVLDRGYSILRTGDGRVLVAAEGAPAGTALTAQLKRGSLKLVSEGNIESGGD
jgi:exodeoxyribonuclease VII large subunit